MPRDILSSWCLWQGAAVRGTGQLLCRRPCLCPTQPLYAMPAINTAVVYGPLPESTSDVQWLLVCGKLSCVISSTAINQSQSLFLNMRAQASVGTMHATLCNTGEVSFQRRLSRSSPNTLEPRTRHLVDNMTHDIHNSPFSAALRSCAENEQI
jgi:hypothetical protein